MDNIPVKLCECGCGEPVTYNKTKPRRFINHHSIRINPISQSEHFRECMRGDKNPAKRPEVRAKISAKGKGKNTGDSNHMRKPEYRKMFSEMFSGQRMSLGST